MRPQGLGFVVVLNNFLELRSADALTIEEEEMPCPETIPQLGILARYSSDSRG